MKVKIISRNPDDYMRQTKDDIHRMPRNYDPALHPFEAAREYVQALNATKLERVFAKPFIGDLDGHRDGISSFAKHPKSLSTLCSGSFDGEVRVWDLITRTCVRKFQAHEGFTRGMCYTPDGDHFLTVGDDKTVKMWSVKVPEIDEEEEPVNTVLSRTMVGGISHHRSEPLYATSGEVCQLWEHTRNEPLKTLKWGVDTLQSISFNRIETNILAACASDRSVILYDRRENRPLRKVVMTMRPNQLAWNPMEAFNFTVASEDFNLYTFDSRSLRNPLKIHTGHVSAVIAVDYSPTGREFVSGSYDKTIRIFEVNKANSRDIYHTKRMQRITCVGWSYDDKFVFSGSDEMNIRLWKARAAEKLGALRPREKAAKRVGEALKQKFSAHPQIRRIANHRQIPSHVYNSRNKMRAISQRDQKKQRNIQKHSKPGSVPIVSLKKKAIVKEDE